MKQVKNHNAQVATPLLVKNGLKYVIIDRVEIFADTIEEQFAVNTGPEVDIDFEQEIKAVLKIRSTFDFLSLI